MPAFAPHLRLLDPARQPGLDRSAQTFGACRVIEECRGPPAVERNRIQLPRNLLELAEHLREHAPPPGWTPTGEAALTLANICSHVKRRARRSGRERRTRPA